MNFGVGLEDVESRVQVVPGPSSLKHALVSVGKLNPTDPHSSMQRREVLIHQLQKFYEKYDETKLQPSNKEAFDKVVEYGMTKGLRRLNAALRDKYNDDLDSARRDNIRQSVREFLANNDPTAPLQEVEADVQFAMDNGVGALDDKLKSEYGATLTTATTF